jgi:G8 domain
MPVGSWYFDELSRTALVVLKPLAGKTPSGHYSFTQCTVTNGCLPQPQKTAPVIFGPKQYWFVLYSSVLLFGNHSFVSIDDGRSNVTTWIAMGKLPPEAGDDVIIPAGRTVVLDQTTPVLGVLWIHGNLILDDSIPGSHYVLKVSLCGPLQLVGV